MEEIQKLLGRIVQHKSTADLIIVLIQVLITIINHWLKPCRSPLLHNAGCVALHSLPITIFITTSTISGWTEPV